MSLPIRVLMLMTPWLATYTHACPHMISQYAIGYTMLKKGLKIRDPVPAPPNVRTVPTAPPPKEKARPGMLVFKDDAWRSASTITPALADAEVSDATLQQHQVTEKGAIEWEINSPITFSYRVREEADVFDLDSDALIFGHLSDPNMLAAAKARPIKRVVVVDDAVYGLFGDRINAYFAHYNVQMELLVLPTTEENKDMDMVLKIAEAIHDLGIDRRLDPVIAIGGGVCMDIVGFAASIYRRRTPYIRVPTTLMGYVDASIGAKTGVNFVGKKNKLGAYLPPALTLLDRHFLATLDQRQLANGAAEIAKMALVKDPELFELLCAHGDELIEHKFQDDRAASRVLYLAIQTMLEELAPNLWEDSLDRLVDFGHIFSLELEMWALNREKLFHGEAVAIDMAFSCCLAHVRGHIDSATLGRILNMMRALQLPVYHEEMGREMCETALYERNKFSQGQKMPLPVGAGESRIFNDITHEQVLEALDEWERRCA